MATGPLWTFGTEEEGREWVGGVQFSPDGDMLAFCKEDEVLVFDIGSGTNVLSFELNKAFPDVLRFSPDGQLIALGSRSGPIYVLNLTSQQLIFKLDGHTTYVRALNFSPDGNILFSGSLDGTVRVWDMTEGIPILVWCLDSGNNPPSFLRTVAVTSLGLAGGGWWDKWIRIPGVEEMYTPGIPEDLTFSPDGDMCIAGLDSGILVQISLLERDDDGLSHVSVYRGHKLPDHVENVPVVDRIKVSTDGEWIISGSKAGEVHFTRPLERSANFIMKDLYWDFDYHPDACLFAAALTNGTVRVWNINPDVRNCSSRPPTPPNYSPEYPEIESDSDDSDDEIRYSW